MSTQLQNPIEIECLKCHKIFNSQISLEKDTLSNTQCNHNEIEERELCFNCGIPLSEHTSFVYVNPIHSNEKFYPCPDTYHNYGELLF